MDTFINTSSRNAIDRTQVAYEACLAEITSVPEAELLPVTLDIVAITTSLIGILPELRGLRGQIEAKWRDFDFASFDNLDQYALALLHAHGACNRALAPKAAVADAAAELTRIRDQLYAVALPLPAYGLISRSALDKCKVDVGYRPLIGDVITLVGVFRDSWPALAGKVPVTEEELLQAKGLALDLQEQLGMKEQAPVTNVDAALLRQKAFTLFIRTYEEARRAVLYLRAAQGDADEIAPSFYALRSGKRRQLEAEVGSTAATPAPAIVIENTANLPMGNPFVS
ncbi:MAG: hypothetical protein RL685_6025 [Pseudomonadota bacterium]|jgi:hypothetical protein